MTRKEKIVERLRELGAEPKRSLGQNFLISDHVVESILTAAKSSEFTDLVEVGPGLGAITDDLITIGAPMQVIELDKRFAESWRSKGLHVIEADALTVNWTGLGLRENSLFVSNLPYQISSSIVIDRSIQPANIRRMVLMFQKEVAQRLTAKPSTKEYGLLSVIAQTFWQISKVVDAGPGAFFPPPKVTSRVMMFKRRDIPELEVSADASVSPNGFLSFTKAAFSQRRKLLSRNLYGSYFSSREGFLPQIEKLLLDEGFTITARAEELDPQAFVRLYLSSRKMLS
jgi:16S rRNA (adenine1518-N6/adenine1519-N6)-dimethyltransferase